MGTYTGTVPSSSLAVGAGLPALWTQQAGGLMAAFGTWTPYTPTITGWTLGNGTIAASYMQVGKFAAFRGTLTIGSTTTIAGILGMTYPVAMQSSQNSVHADAYGNPAGSWFEFGLYPDSATTYRIQYIGTNGQMQSITASLPAVWAAGNTLKFAGSYETA